MGIYRRFESILIGLLEWLWMFFISIHELKNIFSKRKLVKSVQLTKKQKAQIDDFYLKNLGRKVPYWWHQLYTSYTGKFDYKYIPEYLYSVKLENKTNSRLRVLPYEDKNMLQVLFSQYEVFGVVIPKTYVMCVNGIFYNASREIISKDQAVKLLKIQNGGKYKAVIKVTVDTSSGRGVRMLDLKDGVDLTTNEKLESIFNLMGDNFVIQERILSHESLSALYPTSINTMRVITYIANGKINVAPVVLRIGQGGGMVDNAHAGGMFIGVTDVGKLLPQAFTEYQKRYAKHPDTGIVFNGYHIPMVPEIINVAKKMHGQLPELFMISWDFSVTKENKIVLIEANLHSQAIWLAQMAHGKAFFGDNTEEVLGKIKKR